MNLPLVLALSFLSAPPAGERSELESSPLLLLPPSIGAVYSSQGPGLFVSAPIYLQFGPELSASGRHRLLMFQLGLDPSLTALPLRDEDGRWDVAWEPAVALGFRRRWAGEWVRFGVGAWHRVELKGWTASVEPELTMFLGPCCQPGSVELSARVRIGPLTPPAATLRVGFSYW